MNPFDQAFAQLQRQQGQPEPTPAPAPSGGDIADQMFARFQAERDAKPHVLGSVPPERKEGR